MPSGDVCGGNKCAVVDGPKVRMDVPKLRRLEAVPLISNKQTQLLKARNVILKGLMTKSTNFGLWPKCDQRCPQMGYPIQLA